MPLTASYAATTDNFDCRVWEAKAKDHGVPCPASVTVFAIGIRPLAGQKRPRNYVSTTHGMPDNHPSAEAPVKAGFVLTGDGVGAN